MGKVWSSQEGNPTAKTENLTEGYQPLSFEITQAFVQEYRDNVVHLAQQKGSRLRNCVRLQPNIIGMNYYFERVGATGTVTKISRHTPTPLISTPHSRRRVSMSTQSWGDAVDSDDQLKLLINPEAEYTIAARNAFGRAMDDYIIDAVYNPAFSGQDGATSVAFPVGQVVSDGPLTHLVTIEQFPNASNDGGQLSPQRLLAAKKLFDQADVDPDEERYIAVSPIALQSMLSSVPTISADYNTVKTLVEGAVDTFLGFKFIMSNRLPTQGATGFGPFNRTYAVPTSGTVTVNTGDRLAFAWARTGLGFAMQEDVKAEIAKDPSLSFATRLYMEMVMGATRIEEARVVGIPLQNS